MTKIQTNLRTPPYYDDHDENKQFHRILFVPERAVQTREINQLQTLIQEQVTRFGNHVFKDGSVVDGCAVTHLENLQYVRVNNNYIDINENTQFSTEVLAGMLIVSPATGVRGVIRLARAGYEAQYPYTSTLYVDYIKTGRNGADEEVHQFISGEPLTIYRHDQDKFAETLDPNKIYNRINVYTANTSQEEVSVGRAYGINVGEGVVYQKGYFVKVLAHTITVRDYDANIEGMLVGFNTKESIVTHLQDSSLIDPIDNTNRNAIGANRLKLAPVLVAVHKDDITEGDDFFPIVEYGRETATTQRTDPEYTKLGDYISRGIFEPHGDFYIKPFLTSTEENANSSTFNYAVDSGLAYVKGERVELLVTKYINTERATTTEEKNAASTTLNYGNYVLVNEALGIFDTDQFGVVRLYNAPQTSITDIETLNSSASGTLVGTARVKGYVFDSGIKGTASARYRLYISDIKMNSGRSFSSDVKSVVLNTASPNGLAKADIVLENGKAVIKESGKGSLIFDMGVEGMKRLRSATGVNDTQFEFRDITSATLQSNGSVTFTLNSPHAGGVERFFASTGSLSNANKSRIQVALGANNIWTGALSGTVNATTSTVGGVANTIVGTGTTFSTTFKVGDNIRVNNNHVRRIVSIANNTHMGLNQAISDATSAAPYARYFAGGHIFDLDGASVDVLSENQFSVGLGMTFAGGTPQTVYASYPVIRTQAVEAKKNVLKSRFVRINPATNAAGLTGPWNLGLTDVFKIEGVYIGTTYSESNPDRTSWFSFDSGQSETLYDHAKLVLNPSFRGNIDSNSRILVKLSYFEAVSTAGIGFFSVDSYPVRGPGEAANTTNISYADIPSAAGYNLRNCVDFRPRKVNTATSTATAGSATLNPATTDDYVVSTSGLYVGEPDSMFQADIEYYLPRIDLIQANRNGNFNVKKSVPSLNPITPIPDGDSMAIATAYVPPFPSLTATERTRYGGGNPYISTKITGNKAYTMRDIGNIDRRIDRLEYYQRLSMLESQAKDYKVLDENGLDRFKNGIFADPFNNHTLGDANNFEYSIAIDHQNSVARPKFEKEDVDLRVYDTINTVVNGSTVTLPYQSELFISQPYASKYRNATESVWAWNGELDLFPSYDHFRDEISVPEINVNIDMASAWEQFADSPFGTQFGDWRTISSSTSTSTTRSVSGGFGNNRFGTSGGGTETTRVTTTTTNELERLVHEMEVNTTSSSYDLGSYLTDVSISPYMRSRQIAFIASGLKPNSRYWAFFDRKPVSEHCALGKIDPNFYNETTNQITVTDGQESQVVTRTNDWGVQLVSDSNGNLAGIFRIPEGQFRVGDREFMLANVDSLEMGGDAITSSCRSVYTASNMTLTSRSTTIHTREPQLSTRTTTDTSISVSTQTSVSVRELPTFDNSPGEGDGTDPLGQSIVINVDENTPGIHLNKIGAFFKSKDASLGITCVVCELTSGLPDATRIISKSHLKPSEVLVSEDGTAETVFTFTDIPYLTNNKSYAFFLQPDGNSPEYLVWMSEIGGTDLATGRKIHTNPYLGVAYVSANADTWTPLQTEDIKFNVYICDFSPMSGEIVFTEQDDDYITVNGFTVSSANNFVAVGDVVYAQNTAGALMLANTDPFGVVQYVDRGKDLIVLDNSRGGFIAGQTIEFHRPTQAANTSAIGTSSRVATSVIKSVDDVEYSIVVPRVGFVTPFGTNVSLSFRGMDLSNNLDVNYVDVQAETELEMNDKMRVIRSRSNRAPGDFNCQLRMNLETTSRYLTPIIDLRRRALFAIKNIINNDITGEETRNGNASTKYVSQRVVLAEGQDAEDIRVIVSGYRPVNTDIHCYVKFHNSEDSDPFYNKVWTKLDLIEGAASYSSLLNTSDFREYVYGIPKEASVPGAAYLNDANMGIVQYESDGAVYISYKSFSIKLVLTSTSPERVPIMRDVSSISLQV